MTASQRQNQGSQPRTRRPADLQRQENLQRNATKLNSRLRQPPNPNRERSHPRRSDKSEPPYTALLRVGNLAMSGLHAGCAKENTKRFSTLCSPSSSEEKMSFSSSEDIPSIKPKATVKSQNFQLTILSPLMAHPLLVQDLPKRLPMRRRVCRMDCPEVQPLLGSRLDFLFVARVREVNPSIFGFFQGPQLFRLLVFSRFLAFALLGESPCLDNTWLPTLVLRLLQKWPSRRRATLRQLAVVPIFYFQN